MSLTVNIKNLSVSLPGAAKPFPPILALALASALGDQAKKAPANDPSADIQATAGVDITPTTERRYGVIQSHARVAADGSYIAADDTTTPHVAVVDNTTGLMWAVESLGDPKDADDGLPHAECEKRCTELRLLGFDDWRLPTRAELFGLVDDTRDEPAIDTVLFPRVKSRWHWTSTPCAWSSASAWGVGLYHGGVLSTPPLRPRFRVGRAPRRSVIGPLHPPPHRTSHTMSKPTYIKIGAGGARLPSDATEWVAVELPDHGLTFSRTSIVDTDVPQEKCEEACKALTLAGFSDWDLPTIDELQLLVDRTRHSPAIDTDYFVDIENDWYWSKTAAAWSSASAWLVDFGYGYVGNYHRDSHGFALAVRRAGQ